MFAGFYYWVPKWTGVMYNEARGKIHFWWSLISFNVTFFPMHFLGLAGMPRRYADYPMQFADFNAVASVGAFAFGLAQVYFFFFIVLPDHARQGREGVAEALGRRPKAWSGKCRRRHRSTPSRRRPKLRRRPRTKVIGVTATAQLTIDCTPEQKKKNNRRMGLIAGVHRGCVLHRLHRPHGPAVGH